jgi:hypothetical protein
LLVSRVLVRNFLSYMLRTVDRSVHGDCCSLEDRTWQSRQSTQKQNPLDVDTSASTLYSDENAWVGCALVQCVMERALFPNILAVLPGSGTMGLKFDVTCVQNEILRSGHDHFPGGAAPVAVLEGDSAEDGTGCSLSALLSCSSKRMDDARFLSQPFSMPDVGTVLARDDWNILVAGSMLSAAVYDFSTLLPAAVRGAFSTHMW